MINGCEQSFLYFIQANKQAVDDVATSLYRRPLQLIIVELWVDVVLRSDGLRSDGVGVGRD